MTLTQNLDLDRLLKRLHLANARRIWRDLIQRAETEQWSFQRFLDILVAEEVGHRSHTRLARLSHRARFPFLKTIEDFDFTYQSTVRLALLGSALSPDFVTEGRSLILLGKPGRGKTHLAVAIAYRAIQNGFEALFVTAAELIDQLSGAFRNGRLAEALERYTPATITDRQALGEQLKAIAERLIEVETLDHAEFEKIFGDAAPAKTGATPQPMTASAN